MELQFDERTSRFAASLWRRVDCQPVAGHTSPLIDSMGRVIESSPLLGPETEAERFESINWHSGRPSRWLKSTDYESIVQITPEGKLVGDTGFHYSFETESELNYQGRKS